METLLTLTLFGSVVWFWIVVITFLVICFASDINENGFFAFGTLVILVVLFYFKGNVDPLLKFFSLANILSYLGLGLVFSALRTFFAGRTLGKRIKDLPKTRKDMNGQSHIFQNQEYEKKYFIDELKGNVFRWWFMWPVSLITWLVTDLIKDLWDFIYGKLKSFYAWIVELGVNSVK